MPTVEAPGADPPRVTLIWHALLDVSMMLHTSAYGRAASSVLYARVADAKRDDPLAPVTLLVPSNHAGVSIRRLLGSGELGPVHGDLPGIAGLWVLTVQRLAELLGVPVLAAAGRRPVSTPVIAAALRAVLADAPGVFAPVAGHSATVEALAGAHRELAEVSPTALDAIAATSLRAGDVVRIHRAVRDRLAAAWYDVADLLDTATAVATSGAPTIDGLGRLLLWLPQHLSQPAATFLRTLADRAAVEVIAGCTGDAKADGTVSTTLDRLGLRSDGHPQPAPPIGTKVITVSDPEEEVRSAVEAVIAALRDRPGDPPVRVDRIAVLYPTHEPYGRLLAEQLDAAGLLWNGRAVDPLAGRLLGRWVLDLLDLPDHAWRRDRVMRLLAEAPVRGADGRHVPAAAWERVSREAGIVAGLHDWDARLTRFAADARAKAETEERAPEPREWLAARLRRNADHAEALRTFVLGLADAHRRHLRDGPWHDLAEGVHTLVRHYLGGDTRRWRWPEEEIEAARRVEAALDRLGNLDAVEPATTLATFRDTLQLELDGDLDRHGRFGQGLLVGPLGMATGIDLELVVVLGLAEGVLPTRVREDPLLPDAEREPAAGELPLARDRVAEQHRQLLAALAASRGQRILICPRGDLRRSIQRAPSRWLRPTLDALDTESDHVASYAARLRTTAFPSTLQQYRLRALGDGPDDAFAHPLVAADAALARSFQLTASRLDTTFTRYEGNLGAVAAQMPMPTDADRLVSASQLEAWVTCPHSYLMRYLLRVEPVENPEELVEISPLDRGNLIHEILERWLAGELQAGAVPAPNEPWPERARERLRATATGCCADYESRGVTGHPLLWSRERTRLLRDLDAFLDHDDRDRSQKGLRPDSAELAFGDEATTIELGDGRSLRLRGRIDRVDVAAGGAIRIVDYKTGSAEPYRGIPDDPLQGGEKLQLALYAAALRALHGDADLAVEAAYSFVTRKGSHQQIGYQVGADVVERLRQVLRAIVDGMAAGLFPQRPPAGWTPWIACHYCDPDGLGTVDLERAWARIRTAPELAGYVALVEEEQA